LLTLPGYKDGPDVNLMVGLLRIGDINLVSVNGEVYSQIAMRLKASAPANKTIIVTLANGMANSGYIYSVEAYSHLIFQVIGSRLKPGCAEGKIVSTALELMHQSLQASHVEASSRTIRRRSGRTCSTC
jgi:neutral ceramidase